MKKVLVLLALVITAAAMTSCFFDECEHMNTKEKIYEAGCSDEGYTERICKRCGYSYKFDFVAPKGHNITSEVTSPTCTEEGYTTYKCLDCDYSYEADFVVPSGHSYTSSIVDSTCIEEGYTLYTCGCGYSYKTRFTVPNGHKLNSTVVLPKCDVEGYTLFSCYCGYSYKGDPVAPTGHEFSKKITRPSIATSGHTTYSCHTCGFSYDTDYVWYNQIFSGAEGDGNGVLAYGVDISYWNEDVDFEKLKKAGIDYVIIRAGSARQKPDYQFEKHYKGAKAAGLDVGCYFYSYAKTVDDVAEEVEILLDIIDGKVFEYPIYFDMEEKSQEALTTERRMAMCYTFCELLIENGYFPGVYANRRWLKNFFEEEELCTYFDVWYARYPLDSGDGTEPVYFDEWDYELEEAPSYGMWQFTQSGRVDGIDGSCDINACYKDYPALIKKYGYNGN